MQMYSVTELADLKSFGALRRQYDKLGTGAKIGNIRLPNFKANNEMYTKTEATRSDEEILKAVAELAKKHAEMAKEPENIKKKYNFFHNADSEYLDLIKEYISSASPDRESILTNSLNEIFKKASLPRKETGDTLSIKDSLNKSILQQTLQIMERAKNKNVDNKKIWQDGEISGALYNVGIMKGNDLEYAQFFDSSGYEIAKYNNGWNTRLTEEEQVRRKEFLDVYSKAYNSVSQAPEVSLPKSVDCGNSFDVVG